MQCGDVLMGIKRAGTIRMIYLSILMRRFSTFLETNNLNIPKMIYIPLSTDHYQIPIGNMTRISIPIRVNLRKY
jgi:hypothetical protein